MSSLHVRTSLSIVLLWVDISEVLEGGTLFFFSSDQGTEEVGNLDSGFWVFFAGLHGVLVTSVLCVLTASTQGMLRESFHLL